MADDNDILAALRTLSKGEASNIMLALRQPDEAVLTTTSGSPIDALCSVLEPFGGSEREQAPKELAAAGIAMWKLTGTGAERLKAVIRASG